MDDDLILTPAQLQGLDDQLRDGWHPEVWLPGTQATWYSSNCSALRCHAGRPWPLPYYRILLTALGVGGSGHGNLLHWTTAQVKIIRSTCPGARLRARPIQPFAHVGSASYRLENWPGVRMDGPIVLAGATLAVLNDYLREHWVPSLDGAESSWLCKNCPALYGRCPDPAPSLLLPYYDATVKTNPDGRGNLLRFSLAQVRAMQRLLPDLQFRESGWHGIHECTLANYP